MTIPTIISIIGLALFFGAQIYNFAAKMKERPPYYIVEVYDQRDQLVRVIHVSEDSNTKDPSGRIVIKRHE